MTSEERTAWLTERNVGIGSSEIATLVGLGYQNQNLDDLYARKTGERQDDFKPNLRMEMGTFLEPFIADIYTRETGRETAKLADAILRHPERPWQICTPDRVDDNGDINELKAVWAWGPGEDFGEPGTDEVPDYFGVQVQWQLGIARAQPPQASEYEWARINPLRNTAAQIPVLFINAPRLCIYRVEFDAELFEMLTAVGAHFWDLVERRAGLDGWNPPFVAEIVRRSVKVVPGKVIDLDTAAMMDAARFTMCRAERLAFEKKETAAKEAILRAMGDAEVGKFPDGAVVKRKPFSIKPPNAKRERYRFTENIQPHPADADFDALAMLPAVFE